MVANIALMLASQGQSILAADYDLASPSLHHYLTAFLPERPAEAGIDSPLPLSRQFDGEGRVDFIGPVADEVTEPERYPGNRSDLLRHGYDSILVDLPYGSSAAELAGELADVLVLGYRLNQRDMNEAASLARSIKNGPRGADIRVLPVPIRVDRGASEATTRWRADGRRRFAWLLDHLAEDQRQRYWNDIEIPHEPECVAEATLSFLDPSAPHHEPLVTAYLQVAGLLGADAAAPNLQRYREAWRDAAVQSSPVTILHAAGDRYWAEWLAATIGQLGFTVSRRRIDQVQPEDRPAGSVLIVVSWRLLNLPNYEGKLAQAIGFNWSDGPVPVAVSIDDQRLPGDQFRRLKRVNLWRLNESEATEKLAAHYYTAGTAPSVDDSPYFPGPRVRVSVNLPPPARDVAGRDDLIDEVRDYFTTESAPARLTLTGSAGMGKTLVALEYAWRFRAAYDVIVLIRADSAEAIRTDLARYAAKNPPKKPAGDPGAAALSGLGVSLSLRWLLICTGADDPSLLTGLLPTAGQGHILLTAGEEAISGSHQLPVRPLYPDDAEAMVFNLVTGMQRAEADQVASAMERIPLALQLACGWIRATRDKRSRQGVLEATVTEDTTSEFLVRLAEMDEASPGARADRVRAVASMHLDDLGAGDLGDAVMPLLETCAFLGTSGLSWRLLVSPQMLAQLAEANEQLADPIMLRSVLHKIASRGLLVLDDAALPPGDITGTPLRVHPSVLGVVRDRLTPPRRAEVTRRVASMLAASAPLSVDDDVMRNQDAYADLLEHIGPADAAGQPGFAVRQWLVNEVRYLWQSDNRSSWELAATLGEGIFKRWWSMLSGNGDPGDDPLVLRLQTQLANVYRSLGQYEHARDIDEAVLARERRILGMQHPRTLMTARSYGADLRWVGNFERARDEDGATWQAVIQQLGDHHLLALTTSGNLALSELLAGEPEVALDRRRSKDLPWCERFEEERSWETAWVLGHIGALQRELGQYAQSLDSLKNAKAAFERAAQGTVPVPAMLMFLRLRGGIAAAQRHLGDSQPTENDEILEECLALFGEDHELVPATMLSQAGDHYARGNPEAAVSAAEMALDKHIAIFGDDHPFTALNRVNLSIYALAAGQPSLADVMSGLALTLLDEKLRPEHLGPEHQWSENLWWEHLWTLAAAVARSNVLAVTDRLDEAAVLEKRARDAYQARFGPSHEFTQLAEANLAHTERLRNESRTVADPAEEAAKRHSIELDIPPH
jgi:Tetratricopeptide repeat